MKFLGYIFNRKKNATKAKEALLNSQATSVGMEVNPIFNKKSRESNIKNYYLGLEESDLIKKLQESGYVRPRRLNTRGINMAEALRTALENLKIQSSTAEHKGSAVASVEAAQGKGKSPENLTDSTANERKKPEFSSFGLGDEDSNPKP